MQGVTAAVWGMSVFEPGFSVGKAMRHPSGVDIVSRNIKSLSQKKKKKKKPKKLFFRK
jgi:hypothetical protein